MLWQAPAVVTMMLIWLAMPPTDLAGAARRESLRRLLVGPATISLTNQNLPYADPVVASPPPATSVPPDASDDEDEVPPAGANGANGTNGSAPANGAAGTNGSAAVAAKPDAAAGAEGEKFWRDRMTAMRQTLEQDQVLLDALQSRINALNTDFVNRDDPAQRASIDDQRQRATAELDRLTKQVAADQKAIQDLQDEARRKGVPPGWIR